MACWLPLSIEGEPVPKLFKLAFDSLRRQRERTAFTIVGLALAIATVVLVFAISLRFESSSTDSLLYVTQGGNLWMVPALGFDASNRSQFIQTNGRLPADAAATATDGPALVRRVPAPDALALIGLDRPGQALRGHRAGGTDRLGLCDPNQVLGIGEEGHVVDDAETCRLLPPGGELHIDCHWANHL